jgi:hypothetical protein
MTEQKQKRLAAGAAIHFAAAKAGVSPHTWKLFETDPESVTKVKREACETALLELERLASAKAVAA